MASRNIIQQLLLAGIAPLGQPGVGSGGAGIGESSGRSQIFPLVVNVRYQSINLLLFRFYVHWHRHFGGQYRGRTGGLGHHKPLRPALRYRHTWRSGRCGGYWWYRGHLSLLGMGRVCGYVRYQE